MPTSQGIFSAGDEGMWNLSDEMNIKKMTHSLKNEHSKKGKKNLFVTVINFSFSLKVYFTM